MEKMSDLRKGKSAVKEWNHTLLIGWTDRSIAFIQQICLANESEGGGVIVVLSEEEKVQLCYRWVILYWYWSVAEKLSIFPEVVSVHATQ